MDRYSNSKKQESIPVGCIPPVHPLYGGETETLLLTEITYSWQRTPWTETPSSWHKPPAPDKDPLLLADILSSWQRAPPDREPLDRDPTSNNPPNSDHPSEGTWDQGQRLPWKERGTRQPGSKWHHRETPVPWTEWKKHIETLPCPTLRSNFNLMKQIWNKLNKYRELESFNRRQQTC